MAEPVSAGTAAADGLAADVLDEIAVRFGTPCYVYDEAAIVDAYRAYEDALASVPHRICYALKANSNASILRLLASRGASADVVSGFEIHAALRAGFRPRDIFFAGVGKTPAELEEGVRSGIGDFGVESEEELQQIASIARTTGRTARVSLRVNPNVDPRSHPFISTGLAHNKFGIDVALAPRIFRHARNLRGVQLVGVQSHIGSQITDLASLAEAARVVARLSADLQAEGFALETINLGGGLGIDYRRSGGPTPSDLAAAILPPVAALGLTLLVEPGRSVVGRAGVLLTRVLYVKENGGRRFVVVDAAVNDLMRPALYDAYHDVGPVRPRGRDAVVVDVVGPVCETGDFLARDRPLEAVAPGELLVVRDVGAYGFSMSSNYNMRPRAAEVLVTADGAKLIRRRETFEDLVRTEEPGR